MPADIFNFPNPPKAEPRVEDMEDFLPTFP